MLLGSEAGDPGSDRAGASAPGGPAPSQGLRRVSSAVGLASIAAGLIGLATIAWWYGADMGWTGSGSVLVVSRAPVVLGVLMSITAVLLGISTLKFGRALAGWPAGAALLAGATLLAGASVVAALAAYPQVRHAELISHGEHDWKTTVPVTEVFGVREMTAATITIEGRADRRECRWELRAVTIDRSTGTVIDVERLPTAYADESQIPPDPEPVDPAVLEIAQGAAPFICRS
jgi:hypothetical protein